MPIPSPATAVAAVAAPTIPPELEDELTAMLERPWTKEELAQRRRYLPRSFRGLPPGPTEAELVVQALTQAGYDVRDESNGAYGGGRTISVAAPAHLLNNRPRSEHLT